MRKKRGGEQRDGAAEEHMICAPNICERERKSRGERGYYEREGLSRSLESIDKFRIP